MGFLAFLLLGLIAGAIAKAILPGRQGGGWIATLLLGVVGAMLGGWLGSVLFGADMNAFWSLESWLLAIGGSIIVLLIYHAVQAFADLRPLPVALAAVLLAYAVEGLQYLHAADWLGLPRGSVWRVVLGTHFSWGDMAMYTLGGLLAYALDRWLIQPQQPRTQAARTPSS